MTPASIIAIDGPAGSGKSTVAEKLAERLGYLFFDTGVMYRAVTLAVITAGIPAGDEAQVTRVAETAHIEVYPPQSKDGRPYDVRLDGRDVTWELRSEPVEKNVSQVSAYAGVRSAMTRAQRAIGLSGNVIMVGRDIGTVVLPEADLKVYLDASVEERARRRFLENRERGRKETYEEILAAMKRRDQIDSNRAVAPLRPAEDAVVVLTDGMTIEEVVDRVAGLAK